ncbi:16S rRNA (cytosine(1402)-N(4))-methyltransferase [Candidatus Nomurabacteria bacterium RIFCSPHIGHO2_01_FULL_37_110]|nr:MAG: 16S rRNA (cytosine(1402)-N(4))-methyltransferase [Candidatus Nomurabacteria bacterium RIFCSPHIGHO2_01_FULL_37_110]OGI84423.1 MAG: 16S rRNA (cytosine(1402)-N(4))-methyltransferase [Candidatus Nomurabacteria bacterium RIFCSPLOWO2_01_FULL_37_49]
MQSIHRTVLLNETIDGLLASLKLNKGENEKFIVVDATFGGGGHSLEICRKYPSVKIIALDQDKNVFTEGDKFKNCNISFVNDNFRNIDKVLVKTKVEEVDGIIFDLGLSSDQLENSGRGFSFLKDEPLLMTMKENPSREDLTAKEIVNTWSEESLADIIHGYGEERFARRIAKGVVETRVKKKIESSFDLVKVINDSVPVAYRMGHLHPATRTFQALRIAVNDELGALKNGLEKGFKFLKKGGRMSVISFHSLEDRIVKRFYKAKEKEEKAKLINKKPFTPSIEEIRNNNRSRSAKLRILERI